MKIYNQSYADWSAAEYMEILRCIFSGKVADGDNSARLVTTLGTIFAPATIYPMNYGRSAINIALAACLRRRPERMEVVVPAYVCPSVLDAVTGCGLIPVAADVGNDLNLSVVTLAAAVTKNTLAAIVPHMYGCPARIGEIEIFCRDAGIFLIDDAAQIVGVRQDGKVIGTFGDFGIISFAQSKAVVTGIRGSGGVLVVNNSDFDAEIRTAWEALPSSGRRLGSSFDFIWNCVWGPYTGNSGYYAARIMDILRFRKNSPGAIVKISNLEAGIALVQLQRLEIMLANRVRTIEAYHRAVKTLKNIEFPQYAPGRYLTRVMLSFPASVNLTVFRATLKNFGLHTRLGYAAQASREHRSGNAEDWSGRLLGMPCGADIGEVEVQEIGRILSTALDACFGARQK